MKFLLCGLVLFLVFAFASPALAAVNCAPPIGADWVFNSTNSTLLCDNGTAIDLGGYSLILNDNATATFTNGTNLTADTIWVTGNASLSITNGTRFSADIIANGTNRIAITDAVMTQVSPGLWIMARSDSGSSAAVNFTIRNLTATSHFFGPEEAVNVSVANSTFTQIMPIFTPGTQIMEFINTSTTGTFGVSLRNLSFVVENITQNTSTTSTLTADGNDAIRIIGSTFATVSFSVGNGATANFTNVTLFGISALDGDVNVETARLQTFAPWTGGSAYTIRLANVNITSLDSKSSTNLSAITADNVKIAGGDLSYDYTWAFVGTGNELSNITFGETGLSTRYSLILSGNVTFNETEPTAFYANQSVTRVYPLYLVNQSGSPVASRAVKVLRNLSNASDAVWSGTTSAGGYAEPNVTFNATNYNDTLYLYVAGYTAGQSMNLSLLTDTPINWSIDTAAPSVSITTATALPIYAGGFGFNASLGNDSVYANYTISNSSGTRWSNGSWNASQLASTSWNLSRTFAGIYLPSGNWTLNVTALDQYGNARSANATFQSLPAILSTLVSSSSQSADIGGSDIGFSFNVTTKSAGSAVKAFLILTNGPFTYNTAAYARLMNSTANATVSGSADYSGATNVTLPPIAFANVPAYVTMPLNTSGAVYQQVLTLALTPYSGLSAGTYTGSYGFGVFG